MNDETQKALDPANEAFTRYDRNGNGTIDWDEFCDLLDELVEDITLDEKTIAFHLVDVNHTGMISFDEFSAWWNKRGG